MIADKKFGLSDVKAAARSTLKLGKVGHAELKPIVVTKEDADFANLRASITGRYRDMVVAGTYTGLYVDRQLWMSDTPSEINDIAYFALEATGCVLVTGLGMGCAVEAILANPNVKKVVVIEIDEDVIQLVGKQLVERHGSDRLVIYRGDAYTYAKNWRKWPVRPSFDCAWHDVWAAVCYDNLKEMTKMRRHWRGFIDNNGRQGCWAEVDCRRGR